jgi:hypothetical protein
MGGAAFIIHGTMDEVKLAQFRYKPSFFERLVSWASGISHDFEYSIPNKKMKELDVLTNDFRAFTGQIKEPWYATKEILTYLKDIKVNVYLRKKELLLIMLHSRLFLIKTVLYFPKKLTSYLEN